MIRPLPAGSLEVLRLLATEMNRTRESYNIAATSTIAALNVPPDRVVKIDLEAGVVHLKEEEANGDQK